jgi:hypothetical protein
MARYNEILVGRINRGLQKYFGIKGDAPVPQLAGDVAVNHQLFSGAENRYLEGWEKYGSAVAVAAAAANTSCVRFRNPVGSNIAAVIEILLISETVADANLVLRKSQGVTTDLAVVPGILGTNFDDRGRIAPTIVLSQQNTAVGPPALGGTNENSVLQMAMLASSPINLIFNDVAELPVMPGTGLQINCGVVNQALNVTFWWRERFLEEAERT